VSFMPEGATVAQTTECSGDRLERPRSVAPPSDRSDTVSIDPQHRSGEVPRPPLSPGHAYAALCGLSCVPRPSDYERARMRLLARYLLDAAAERREVAA
jgi:hypothetical protein